MDCEHIKELLSAYLDGELSVDQRQRVEEHLFACAGCRQELDELKSVSGLLRSMGDDRAPADFRDRVRARMKDRSRLDRFLRSLTRNPQVKIPVGLAVAGLIALAVVRQTDIISRPAEKGAAERQKAPAASRSVRQGRTRQARDGLGESRSSVSFSERAPAAQDKPVEIAPPESRFRNFAPEPGGARIRQEEGSRAAYQVFGPGPTGPMDELVAPVDERREVTLRISAQSIPRASRRIREFLSGQEVVCAATPPPEEDAERATGIDTEYLSVAIAGARVETFILQLQERVPGRLAPVTLSVCTVSASKTSGPVTFVPSSDGCRPYLIHIILEPSPPVYPAE
ncbi:MAG: hypothetical protein GF333_03555 [Candidatus Omnitrophica bacterium]|nr:hypothetical protein [Candidatus Omnitrophota bacterium]